MDHDNLAVMADRTESSIVIAAPPGTVLDVIADFEAYPEWAGDIKRVSVLSEEADGWPDAVEFTLDAGVIKDTYTLRYDWDFDEDAVGALTWSLVRGNILRAMDGSYTLVMDGDTTHVTYQLTVDLTIPMLGMLKRKAEKTIVDTALKELKKRVEG